MQAQSKHFKEVINIKLSDSISSIDVTKNTLAAGCVDNSLFIWNANFVNFNKDPRFTCTIGSMGIVDLVFDKKSNYLSVCHYDSSIKLYQLGTFNHSSIESHHMQNWRVQFLGESLVTCGSQGKITYYDISTKRASQQKQVGRSFLTTLAKSNTQGILATANVEGDLFIIQLQGRRQAIKVKPHFKKISQLAFVDCDKKIATACEDESIKTIDIETTKVVSILQGHRQAVSSICQRQSDPSILFSSSLDKTLRCWDIRVRRHIASTLTGSVLWDVKSVGKNVITGGDNEYLYVYQF